jgi:hypothetical protein
MRNRTSIWFLWMNAAMKKCFSGVRVRIFKYATRRSCVPVGEQEWVRARALKESENCVNVDSCSTGKIFRQRDWVVM